LLCQPDPLVVRPGALTDGVGDRPTLRSVATQLSRRVLPGWHSGMRKPARYGSSMFTASTFLSWVLATTPESQPEQARDIERVEIDRSDDSVQVTARDSDGEVSAEVFLWTDGEGRIRLDAAWPDGLYLSVVTDGETATVDTDNQQEAAARVGEVHDFLALTEPQAGPVPCGVAVVSGIYHAVTANPFVIVDAVLAACECLPLLVEEWEGYHCPGFG
jgi:hypothetical protein